MPPFNARHATLLRFSTAARAEASFSLKMRRRFLPAFTMPARVAAPALRQNTVERGGRATYECRYAEQPFQVPER